MQGTTEIESRYQEWALFWAKRLSPHNQQVDAESLDRSDYLQALLTVAWLAREKYRSAEGKAVAEESRYVLGALRKGAWALSRRRARRQRMLRELLGDVDLATSLRWALPEYQEDVRFECREALSWLQGMGFDLSAVAGIAKGMTPQARFRAREAIKAEAPGMF